MLLFTPMKASVVCLLLSLFAGNLMAQEDCAYISVKKGVNIYARPDTLSDSLGRLEYGRRVKILDTVEADGTDWLWIDHGILHYCGPRGNTAYVTVSAVSRTLEEIPEKALYNYYKLSLSDDYRISFFDDPFEHNTRTNCCYPYYGSNLPVEENHPYDLRARDTFKSYFSLSLVNPKDLKRVKNPYIIDTTKVHRVFSTPDYMGTPGAFYLYVNNGQDSVLIKDDQQGEYYTSTIYVGQIHKLDKYVINERFEEPNHVLIDRSTGEKVSFSSTGIPFYFFTTGIPYISPDGKYVVDLSQMYFPSDDNGCYLTISKMNDSLRPEKVISVHFKSWAASEEVNSAFWVSDRELAIKAFPIDNFFRWWPEDEENKEKINYQYIKLTIKE